jgi:hypothetical protein
MLEAVRDMLDAILEDYSMSIDEIQRGLDKEIEKLHSKLCPTVEISISNTNPRKPN